MGDKKFQEACLKAHNEFRKNHGVPALKLNKEISVIAQRWAEHLAKTDSFSHSKDRDFKGQKMGENIAMKSTSSRDDYTGQQVTDQWYSEVTKYNFQASSGAGTGHFTQVVWKDSKEFGVGKSQANNGAWIVVANYLPAGNFIGKFKENVFPPKDGKIGVPAREEKGSAGGATGGGFSRPSPTEPVRSTDFSSSSSTRTVTREVREGSGPSYTKTIVTETIVGPDGKKKTVTRETVTSGGDAAATSKVSEKFNSMDLKSPDTDDKAFGTSGATSRSEPQKESGKEKKPQKMKDFIDDVIKYHNKYRKLHNKVGDVKHNKELSVLAQRWADHLAATKTLQHSNDTYKGDPVGENVASRWSSVGADYTGQQVVDQWYDEVKKYDFSRNEFTSGTGHFTQVVWKASKEIGVGKTLTSDGRVFVVCNYMPAGNIMGQFAGNVFPPSK